MKATKPFRHHSIFLLLAATVATVIGYAPAKTAPPTSDTFKTRRGVLRITPKFHASLQIEFAGRIIEVDPVSAASYTRKADIIIITHAHPDHLDLTAIKKLATGKTFFVANEAITKQVSSAVESGDFTSLHNGDTVSIEVQVPRTSHKTTIKIEVVPMYNVVRGPKQDQKYHPKGDGNGYILTLGGKRIYIAGDTEVTSEMKALKNIDIAFLPMNLPFTMTPQEAARGARAFKPKIVYPYHFRYPFHKANTNAEQFVAALKGSGIQVRVRNWYPKDAVARTVASAKK